MSYISKVEQVKASMSRDCLFRLANDKNWYYFVADEEYGRYPDGSWYGPFNSEMEADRHLSKYHPNPGSADIDSSGTRPPPNKYIKP